MNDSLIPISSTEFSEYFDDIGNCKIYRLSQNDAELYWHSIFMDNSRSYFSLSDDNWFIRSNSHKIGEWINAYNSNSNIALSEILTKEISWQDDNIIRFCISSSCIFQTTWQCFNLHWSDFLAIDDDCPIVFSTTDTDSSICFRPIGDIVRSYCPNSRGQTLNLHLV